MSWLFFLAVLAGLDRGLHEGMANIALWDKLYDDSGFQPVISPGGVRCHRWHGSWYHRVSPLRDALFWALGFLACRELATGLTVSSACLIAGSLAALWETAEIGNALARQGRLIYRRSGKLYEAVNFGIGKPVAVTGRGVPVLHGARIALFITLLTIGGMV